MERDGVGETRGMGEVWGPGERGAPLSSFSPVRRAEAGDENGPRGWGKTSEHGGRRRVGGGELSGRSRHVVNLLPSPE